MIERLAIDANAAIDLMRADRADPAPIAEARAILLPLPVLGELFTGAFSSRRPATHMSEIEESLKTWRVIEPDVRTALVYGDLRARIRLPQAVGMSKLNDLWIAALCLQHDLPLLTNDHGFDDIAGLTVIHW